LAPRWGTDGASSGSAMRGGRDFFRPPWGRIDFFGAQPKKVTRERTRRAKGKGRGGAARRSANASRFSFSDAGHQTPDTRLSRLRHGVGPSFLVWTPKKSPLFCAPKKPKKCTEIGQIPGSVASRGRAGRGYSVRISSESTRTFSFDLATFPPEAQKSDLQPRPFFEHSRSVDYFGRRLSGLDVRWV
jgi:hypothetical protein